MKSSIHAIHKPIERRRAHSLDPMSASVYGSLPQPVSQPDQADSPGTSADEDEDDENDLPRSHEAPAAVALDEEASREQATSTQSQLSHAIDVGALSEASNRRSKKREETKSSSDEKATSPKRSRKTSMNTTTRAERANILSEKLQEIFSLPQKEEVVAGTVTQPVISPFLI